MTKMKLIVLALIMLAIPFMAKAAEGGKVQAIDQKTFASQVYDIEQQLKKGDKLAIVDFNAVWCGPCRQLAPILEELAQEYKGKVEFYSIDVDENKALARAMGIRNIPYVVFYPQNGKPHEMVGLQPKQEIKALIDADLEKQQ